MALSLSICKKANSINITLFHQRMSLAIFHLTTFFGLASFIVRISLEMDDNSATSSPCLRSISLRSHPEGVYKNKLF